MKGIVEDPEEGFEEGGEGEQEGEQEGGGEVVEGEGVVAPDLREASVRLS